MNYVNVAAGVIFNEQADQVLLALRKPEQHQGNRWEFPGGKLEIGESPKEGLVRELSEEIGITATHCLPRDIIEHRYPGKLVRLHFWDVLAYEGTPGGLEGQLLQWVALSNLGGLSFPEANQAIVKQLMSDARIMVRAGSGWIRSTSGTH